MNYAIVLSGGVGSRMRMEGFPKQYIDVEGKPILVYTLEVFERCEDVHRMVIVAADQWHENIRRWVDEYGISKFTGFAEPGDSRQESILNGLNTCMEMSRSEQDNVIIHDAVRPCVTESLISNCFAALAKHDGCMPVIPVNDTVYQSMDGSKIANLLDRNTLYAGQAPEAFRLWSYTRINREADKHVLETTRGTSVIAYQNGMDVCLIPGDDENFKITTPIDLKRFKAMVVNQK